MIATRSRRWRGTPAEFVRWGTRAASSKSSWRLYEATEFDEDSGDLGTVGAALWISHLSADARAQLVEYAREGEDLDDEKIAAVQELIGTIPRASVAGYDVDLADEVKFTDEGGALAAEAAEFLREVEPLRLRESYSSGDENGGRHHDFGPIEEEARAPDVERTMFRRCCMLLERAGAVRVTKAIWTLPRFRGVENPPVTIDLTRMNHDPSRRGGLYRPLGGTYKDGRGRKRLVPGSPQSGPWVTVEDLAIAPAAAPQRKKKRWRGHKAPKEVPVAKRLPRTAAWFGRHWQSGAGHELRKHGAGALLDSGLVQGRLAVEAIAGTGNLEDAERVVESTTSRRDRGGSYTSAPHLATMVKSPAMLELAVALHEDLAAGGWRGSLAEVWRRLGGGRRAWPRALDPALEVLAEREALGDELAGKVLRQLRGAGRCGHYSIRAKKCCSCGLPGCQRRLHCGMRGACGRCASRWVEDFERVLAGNLTETCHLEVLEFDSFEAAKIEGRKISRREAIGGECERSLRLVAPGPSGKVRLLLIWAGQRVDLVVDPTQRIARHQRLPRPEALKLVTKHLLGWLVYPLELLERGDAGAYAEALMRQYDRHAVQSRVSTIPAPSRADMRASRAAALQELRDQGDVEDEASEKECPGCPADMGQPWKHGWQLLVADDGIVVRDLAKPVADAAAAVVAVAEERPRLVTAASRRALAPPG